MALLHGSRLTMGVVPGDAVAMEGESLKPPPRHTRYPWHLGRPPYDLSLRNSRPENEGMWHEQGGAHEGPARGAFPVSFRVPQSKALMRHGALGCGTMVRDEGRFDPLMKARITKEGLLIPREVAERALPGSEEVEILEEPGRLLIAPASGAGGGEGPDGGEEDPILNLGRNPVRTGTRDGSANHDRYLYGG